MSYEAWLRSRNVEVSRKIFLAIRIFMFDFEFFIGGLRAHMACVF